MSFEIESFPLFPTKISSTFALLRATMDVALLPPPNATAKRADLLSLKVRLATILPPEEGQLYWATLVKFCSGKINREELGIVLDKVMKHDREARTSSRSTLRRALC